MFPFLKHNWHLEYTRLILHKSFYFWIRLSMEIVFSPSAPSSFFGIDASISLRSSAFRHAPDVCTLLVNILSTFNWPLNANFCKDCILNEKSCEWKLLHHFQLPFSKTSFRSVQKFFRPNFHPLKNRIYFDSSKWLLSHFFAGCSEVLMN